jgi:vacuolar-type H+-ATPase subunit H
MTAPVKDPYATLEVIRTQETAVQERLHAQKTAQARALAAARQQARDMLVQAETDGRLQGEAEFAQGRLAIEGAATTLLDAAQRDAEAIRRAGAQAIATAVAHAVAFISEEAS